MVRRQVTEGGIRARRLRHIPSGFTAAGGTKYRKSLEPGKFPFPYDYRLEFGLPPPGRRARIEACHRRVLGRQDQPRAAARHRRGAAPPSLAAPARPRLGPHPCERLLLLRPDAGPLRDGRPGAAALRGEGWV